ncbi:Major facilitator superfamily domain, general substrate transporter [Pseudocohnilembus persalinus]|uniref:Major facilitator superfamily domain, general substrate transporter n=1 Tax=Pseudocohnilembus persalinus TaxID=266149 RepID=A0A0V0R766_PSEPJ|nr:Major facilitator superfamily domain, general substrate transporter [Pseudocohnilembus persalinus]|eukprot:KRX10208.1 Major facilitator superfamily domain, general substrate transporter [Pseudocohnilembus persalinus]
MRKNVSFLNEQFGEDKQSYLNQKFSSQKFSNNLVFGNDFLDENEEKILQQQLKESGRKIFVLSISFQLLFCAFGTAQNMVSSLFRQINLTYLGDLMLFTLYFFLCLSSLVAGRIIKGKAHQLVFLHASLGYNAFVMFGLILSFCDLSGVSQSMIYLIYSLGTLISIYTGICSGMLWICQGDYIYQVVKDNIHLRSELIPKFWAIYQSYNIVGNFLAFFLLGYSTKLFFVIILIFGLIGSYLFLYHLPNAENQVENEEEKAGIQQSPKKKSVKNSRFSIIQNEGYKLSNLEFQDNLTRQSKISQIYLNQNLGKMSKLSYKTIIEDEEQQNQSLSDQFKNMGYLIKNKETQKLIINCFITGCFTGFVIGFCARSTRKSYSQSLVSEEFFDSYYMNQLICLVFMFQGFVSYFAGSWVKQFCQKFNLYRLVILGNCLGILALSTSLYQYFQLEITFCFVISGDYPNIIEIYSIQRCAISFGSSFMFFCLIYMNDWQLIILALVIQIFSLTMQMTLQAPDLNGFQEFKKYIYNQKTKIKQPLLKDVELQNV